jgi:DNA-directed RNA polymerase specialized sigma24 family protein
MPIRTSDHVHLEELRDDELIAVLREARDRGDADAARTALQMLVFGYMDTVRRRVALKVPAEAADDVAGQAMVSAIGGAFRGGSVGEFRAWMHVIVDRRIADYHRAGRLEVVALGDDVERTPSHGAEQDAVETANVVEVVMSELTAVHRAVIDLYVFDDLPATETAAEIARRFPWPPHAAVTADNVHKIAQRFRDRLRSELERDTD